MALVWAKVNLISDGAALEARRMPQRDAIAELLRSPTKPPDLGKPRRTCHFPMRKDVHRSVYSIRRRHKAV